MQLNKILFALIGLLGLSLAAPAANPDAGEPTTFPLAMTADLILHVVPKVDNPDDVDLGAIGDTY